MGAKGSKSGNQSPISPSPSTGNLAGLGSPPPPPPQINKKPFSGRKAVKIGNIQVHVTQGRIQDEKADVIVTCVSPDLDLSKGHTTSAVSRTAGRSLQNECNEHYGGGIDVGDVAITRGGKLKCNRVYHITLPQWTSGGDANVIGEAVENVLTEADKAKATSLTLPPLGSGYLNYSLDVAAQQMFKGVTEFVNKNSSTSIRHVTFVVFTDESCKPVYEALEAEARRISTQGVKKSVKIGGISVRVIRGKIQEEKADVIVNCASSDLDLGKGFVTRALSRAAGELLQGECNEKYPDGIEVGEVATTTGGNLKCNRVYHVTLPSWTPGGDNAISEALLNILTEAHAHGVTSLTCSPLGAGYLSYSADVIAKQMFKAIKEFVNQNTGTTVKIITIVVVTVEDMTPVFQALEAEARSLSVNTPSKSHVPINGPLKRGTKSYFKDLYQQPSHSPCYWSRYNSTKSLKEWNISGALVKTVTVDQSTYDAVEKVVMNTWKQQFVGLGQDASGLGQLGYSKVKVKKVERVENPVLFETYSQDRDNLFRKAGNIGTFKSLESLSNVQEGPVLTTAKCDSILMQDMFPEINEHYLFHGTCVDNVDAILSQGLDCRLTNNAALGKGVYTAESSTKADQYADPANNRDKTSDKKMLLVRVCLGEICVLNQAKSLKRPPCKVCHQDSCNDTDHAKNGVFNSVVTDKVWNFREFVVYDRGMCYPEYVITYVRQ